MRKEKTGFFARIRHMKALMIIGIVVLCLFVLTVIVYWFNLDMKLIRSISLKLKQHYDTMPRDRRL